MHVEKYEVHQLLPYALKHKYSISGDVLISEMLTGQIISSPEPSHLEVFLGNPMAELDDEESELHGKIIYYASFNELREAHVQYDTIIWVLISLPMVLAWGIGVFMLFFLPVKRYILKKDISSRRLYVTSDEVVYKVTRPSFLPFLGVSKIEKHIPLHLVIDIIIEQGCLQSAYGIHTLRIESRGYGKMTPVDELQVQGLSNPGHLKKIIVTEASRSICESARCRKASVFANEEVNTPKKTMRSVSEAPSLSGSPYSKVPVSPLRSVSRARGVAPCDLLAKLDEVKQSVERIEALIDESQLSARGA